MPWSGPRAWPAAISRSARRASSKADSRISVTTALYRGPRRSSRSRQPSVKASEVSLRARSWAPSARTGVKKVASSSMAASLRVEGEIGLVAVLELDLVEALAGLEVAVEVLGDGIDLLGAELLPVTPPDDRRQRPGVFRRRLGRRGRGRRRRGGGGRARARGRWRGRLGERKRRGRERGGEPREPHGLQETAAGLGTRRSRVRPGQSGHEGLLGGAIGTARSYSP